MKAYLYRTSNLKSYHLFSGLSFVAEINFWRPLKTVVSCDLFIISIGNHMGLSAIWEKIACNRQVIARGEAECNLGLL